MTTISVIIPVKNGTNYLSEAITSVQNQVINNNFEPEIIVVDDRSTDDSAALAKSFGVKCLSTLDANDACGPGAARNCGLSAALGKYILFLDHDDVLINNALITFLQEFELDKDLQFIEAKAKDFISPELSEKDKQRLVAKIESYSGFLSGAMIFRRDYFDVVGNFNENIKSGETLDLVLRPEVAKIKSKKIDFVSVLRRLHNTNTGRTMRNQEFKDYASILKARLIKKAV
jgi:glycosyltransferase involved in cell wall biosynthesis